MTQDALNGANSTVNFNVFITVNCSYLLNYILVRVTAAIGLHKIIRCQTKFTQNFTKYQNKTMAIFG